MEMKMMVEPKVTEGYLSQQLASLGERRKFFNGPCVTADHDAKLFIDRFWGRNHWYVLDAGRVICGPFETKTDAILWNTLHGTWMKGKEHD